MGIHSSQGLLNAAWPPLLARAEADELVTDKALLRMFEDAHDHGVQQPQQQSKSEGKFGISKSVLEQLERSRCRLAALTKLGWQDLPTTKKVHRMRRCKDRRFDSDSDSE
ncbi:unnamed protein product [Polarella glacialis]|uniref:Uncharacterized protein n=1 Tax=Polarella glacialis TaxID=89957 RepID=A0A813F6E0_POLGL|nr:unnamed protein product [Polarella glacialis]